MFAFIFLVIGVLKNVSKGNMIGILICDCFAAYCRIEPSP